MIKVLNLETKYNSMQIEEHRQHANPIETMD
jgi:hypothetical protein